MAFEEVQVRKLRSKDTVTRKSLAEGLQGEAAGDWLTILLITQSPATVILTVYDPDTRREIMWSGDPLHTVYRSAEF